VCATTVECTSKSGRGIPCGGGICGGTSTTTCEPVRPVGPITATLNFFDIFLRQLLRSGFVSVWLYLLGSSLRTVREWICGFEELRGAAQCGPTRRRVLGWDAGGPIGGLAGRLVVGRQMEGGMGSFSSGCRKNICNMRIVTTVFLAGCVVGISLLTQYRNRTAQSTNI